MLHAKNSQNQPMLHGVIKKIKVTHFIETQCSLRSTCCERSLTMQQWRSQEESSPPMGPSLKISDKI